MFLPRVPPECYSGATSDGAPQRSLQRGCDVRQLPGHFLQLHLWCWGQMVHACRGPLPLPHPQREALPIYPGPILRSIPSFSAASLGSVNPFASRTLPLCPQLRCRQVFPQDCFTSLGAPFRLLQSACGPPCQSPCLGCRGTSCRNLLSTSSVSSHSR